jgi:hypothetical protein
MNKRTNISILPVLLLLTFGAIGANAQLSLYCQPSPTLMPVGTPYDLICVASGGTAPYSFALAGATPPGLAPMTVGAEYLLQGAPTTPGTFAFTISVNDSGGSPTAWQAFTISVTAIGGPTLTSIAGSAPLLSLTGTGFTNSATVFFNGVAFPTTIVNSTLVTVSIPAALAAPGTYPVYVHDSATGNNSDTVYVTFPPSIPGVTLTSLATLALPVNSAGFVLTLYGAGFTKDLLVTFGSHTLGNTFINSGQIEIFIPAAYLTVPGSVSVSVAGSNSLPFVIYAGNPLSIACVPVFGPATLGSFFQQSCTVTGGNGFYTWTVTGLPPGIMQQNANGSMLMVSGTPTTIQPYSYTIQVVDTATHSGITSVSGAIYFPGNSYVLSSLSPASAPVGSSEVSVVLTGAGFTPASVVSLGNTVLNTNYLSLNQLNAIIPANLLTNAGTFNITVTTAGVATAPLPFTVGPGSNPGGIVITSLSPTGVAPGNVSFTLTIFGSGFTAGNTVTFGNTVFAANFLSSTQLNVFIPGSLVTTPGSVNVSVSGSNSLAFLIGSQLNVNCNPPNGSIFIGNSYSITCNAVGGTPPYTWTISTVPPGMNLAPGPGGASITMSGIPTVVGVQPVTFTAHDSNATPNTAFATATMTVQVSMPSTKVGVFRAGVAFLEDSNGNGIYDPGIDRYIPNFTGPGGFIAGDFPVTGDWTGDGRAKVGIYRQSTGQWFLDANNNGIYDAGDYTYSFGGIPGDLPFTGDWTGQGKSCIGLFRYGAFWLLDLNCNGSFDGTPPDAFFGFGGVSGDVPVVGAWFGGLVTHVGFVRKYAPGGVPQGNPFLWVFDQAAPNAGDSSNLHQPAPGLSFAYGGLPGDVYVSGDWYNTGVWTAGVYRNGYWVLDAALPGAPQAQHVPGLQFGYGGVATDIPVTGKW